MLSESRETKATCDSMQRNLVALVAMHGSIPKDLGYTWEGGELKQHLTLVQASGEVQIVPMHCCATFEVCCKFGM